MVQSPQDNNNVAPERDYFAFVFPLQFLVDFERQRLSVRIADAAAAAVVGGVVDASAAVVAAVAGGDHLPEIVEVAGGHSGHHE